MIHVGIDLHISNMVNVALNDHGEMVQQANLPSTREALQNFFSKFDEPVQAVVESTSNWYWLADWCQAHGIPLTLAHAKMVKAISYAKVKTDKVDARTLAERRRVGLVPEAYKLMGAQRELTRERLRMVQRRERLQTSVWNLAGKHNLQIADIGWQNPKRLADGLVEQLPPAAGLEARLNIQQLVHLQDHMRQLEAEIERQSEFTADLELLLPIPGVGLVTGWSVLAETGDIRRFPSDKQFCSYCRLVPGSSDSGGTRRHQSGNKDGNKYLRVAFGQAAVKAYSHYGPVKRFYNKVKRRSGKPVARAVVAKIVWPVLAKGEPYKGFKGHPRREASRPCWPQPISPKVRQVF